MIGRADKWIAHTDVTQDYALSSQFIEIRVRDIQSRVEEDIDS